MKVFTIGLLLFLSTASAKSTSQDIPGPLKAKIASTIDALDWYDEELGNIWIRSYSAKNGVEGSPGDWSFQKTKDGIEVEFTCGSEFDESEMMGRCLVGAVQAKGQWNVAVYEDTCICGSY